MKQVTDFPKMDIEECSEEDFEVYLSNAFSLVQALKIISIFVLQSLQLLPVPTLPIVQHLVFPRYSRTV